MSKQKLTEIQEKWIQALESGEYQQCEKRLHDGHGYCCLGVAAVVLGREFEPVDFEWGYHSGDSRDDFETAGLADVDTEALGLWGALGEAAPGSEEGSSLFSYNDGTDWRDPWTFEQIAALLREHPERYFKPNE